MLRPKTLVLLLAMLPGIVLSAQSPPSGLTRERLTRIDRALQRYVDENQIAGAVALVLRDGQPVYERAVGWRDKEAGQRMAADTIFRIASQTKAVTSVAILSLVEEGTIGLDDPASRFIPSFAKTTVAVRSETGVAFVPARRPITIRDLLTHTAGISYGTQSEVAALYEAKGLGPAAGFGWFTADKSEPICDTMARLGTLPFVAQPGERWVYGYNTDVLGCIVERASGVPLDDFIRTRITGPLGMTDTHFFLPPNERGRLAVVYASGSDGRIVRAPDGSRGQGAYVDGPRRSFAGGAGLLSTARDYARFLEMIRRGGALDGVRILAPRTVQLMTTNQVGTLHSPTGLGFGLGFETTDRFGANGLDSQGAFGWAGAYGTIYRVDPEARLVLVLMIQLLPNATDIRQTFPTLVYQALDDPPAPEPLSIARQGYVFAGGTYSTVNGRRVMSGQLYAEYQIPSRQMHPWPIVMVHGGSQSGTNFTGTPDGREGWAQFFLRQGYAVYVVDQPGRGRAAYEADVYGRATQVNLENTERRFVAPERSSLWPQARLHTQWPGAGAPADPAFDQFFASQLPSIQDFTRQQALNRDALVALLDTIGPAILLTHSQAGAFGWPVADARPNLVKAIVAVEPNGPPFFGVENIPSPDWFRDTPTSTNTWGITAVPLVYAPPAAQASDLAIVRQDTPDAPNLARCWMQQSPARRLPNLATLPILILTAEASYHAPYDHCTVKYLQQAGVRSTWIKLAEAGIHGNGHMMMLEKNNAEIAAVIAGWLAQTGSAVAHR